jgi:hypothetical protein
MEYRRKAGRGFKERNGQKGSGKKVAGSCR